MENRISVLNNQVATLKQEIESLKKQLTENNNENDSDLLEKEYKSLYHTIPMGVMHYNADGIIQDCNDKFVKMIGSSHKDLVGLNMIKRLPNKKLLEAVKQSLKTGNGYYEGIYKSITADNEINTRIIFSGLRDSNNTIYGGICIAEDTTESINNQLALFESEENYKLIFENTTDVYYRTNKEGTILSISPAVTELLLIDNYEELIGKNILDFYYNTLDRKVFIEELKKNGRVQEYRLNLKKSNGKPVTVELNSKIIHDANGKLESIIGVFYDVTGRIEAEIEKSTNIWFFERLDMVDKIIRTAINTTQVYKGVASFANEAFQCDSALVYSYNNNGESWKLESSVLSKDYNCTKDPGLLFADPKKSDEIFDRILMYETHVIIDSKNVDELNVISKEIGIEAQMMTSIHLNSGNSLILCINHCKDKRYWNKHEIALFTEMTNRLADAINTLESTELLFKSEEHHRLLIESTSEGYMEINQKGITTVANNAMCEMLGFHMAEFIGKSALIFPTLESRKLLENMIFNLTNKAITSFEVELQHKNGNKVYTLFNITRRKDEYDNNIGAFFFVTDISKQREALDKAEESDNLKTIFIKNISHEVRTPLNGIIGFLGMLNDDNLTKDERLEYTKYVNASSDQLTKIITDILEYSRLEAGQINTSVKKCNLNNLLDELYAQFTTVIDAKNKNHLSFTLNKALSDDESNINTDQVKIKQILSSLLDNAIKYTKEGEISFGYKLLDNNIIRFYIHDSGIGIPENDREIIFEKFRNGSATNNAVYGGNGLGLSISKSLTELLGGNIWYDSDVGVGTKFYVNIPISKSVDVPSKKYVAPSIKNSYQWPGKKVLIVDDVYEVYKLISVYLRSTKIEYLYAKNGVEAIELVNQNSDIDIVLLDIQLPDIDGYQVVKKIKSLRKNLPVIAQTAFALSDDKEKTLSAGFDDYTTKPIYKQTLFEIMDKYL
jgi:PAS domain S-box-containing protein